MLFSSGRKSAGIYAGLQNVYTEHLEEIVTDNKSLYEAVSSYAKTAFPENTQIRLYETNSFRSTNCTAWKAPWNMDCMKKSG